MNTVQTRNNLITLHSSTTPRSQQQGFTLLAILFLVLATVLVFLGTSTSATSIQLDRERITTRALIQAKEALIAYAATRELDTDTDCYNNCTRPGDLPCPDMNNDGTSEPPFDASCGNADGSTAQEKRLGRLPWKTLRLPDLRDGYGERLWYAVSNNFKNNFRQSTLNSDTPGTITLRDSRGSVIFDGRQNGVVAVIIAPGPALQRQGDAVAQDRSCTQGSGTDPLCMAKETCTAPAMLTSKCNPRNYLDLLQGIEDNAQFIDGSSVDGFINGPIQDANGHVVVNDRILVITVDDIMPQIEKRVIGEVRTCLIEYAAANNGRYPWAAALDPLLPPSYIDSAGAIFGRVPDTKFDNTQLSSSAAMSSEWPALPNSNASKCKIISDKNWWYTNKWREFIFYGIAPAFAPASTAATGCGACLQVSPSGGGGKQFVVIASGRKLSGQNRTSNADKGTITNYLELENGTPTGGVFHQGSTTSSYNDQTVFWPRL